VAYRLIALLLLLIFTTGCIEVVDLPTEIPESSPRIVSTTLPEAAAAATLSAVQPTAVEPTATATMIPSPTITPTATATSFFLQQISTSKPPYNENNPQFPRHGIWIVLLTFTCLMIPWAFGQLWYMSYAQPKGFDVTEVLIKAQDGLFLTAVLSMTARKTFTNIAVFASRWSKILEFVSKSLEQELIHAALKYETVEELEQNLYKITDALLEHPIVQELWVDFGIRVIRFNIETRYPQGTRDALNRKAEASADGQAYLAYAQAAHLDPNDAESRELYQVYQQTKGQVDAARNLGGGITNLANIIGGSDNDE